mgnify:CR=1 FL=1
MAPLASRKFHRAGSMRGACPQTRAPAIRCTRAAAAGPRKRRCVHVHDLLRPVSVRVIAVDDDDAGIVARRQDAAEGIVSVND